jgi:predicted transposase YbfD/YdcC
MDDARKVVEGLRWCFSDLEDPRVTGRCDHLLLDVITITILAVMSHAEDWTDIELFGRERESWLRRFLELPEGIPSHDTFQRVFGLLDRKQFAAGLLRWTQALHEATGGKILSIDGKALRRSLRRKSGLPALHLVTMWASENGLTLAQVAVEDKSNEITAIPEVLRQVDIKGCTVTIDAMGCQKQIAEQIREQKGHYVLALKGNQSGLEAEMNELFQQGMNRQFAGMAHDCFQTSERGHGREEERTCHVLEIPADHPQKSVWKDLRTLAVVNTRRVVDGQERWESRSYISDLPPRAKPLAKAIRSHWSIENSQHWVLDIAFREDDRRQQDRNGATNLAAVRRLAVSLFRQDKSIKNGAKAKRLKAALNPNYLLHVLKNAKFDA